MHEQRLNRDEWGRHEVYVAEWTNSYSSNSCIFAHRDAAIFFVVTGLGSQINWMNFPDPAKKYPNEDRDGNSVIEYDPLFIVKQKFTLLDGTQVDIGGSVKKTSVADVWIVGNGIAEWSKKAFILATGRDLVELSGENDQLQGKVGGRS